MRRVLPLLAVLGLLLATAASADTVADVVSQVSGTTYRDYLDNRLFTHFGDARGFDVAGAARYPNVDHDPARDNILGHFTGLGLAASLDPFTWTDGSGNTYYGCNNVVAVQTGTVRPDDIYILGAHYDSVRNPGADDNASGVAGIMEAARVLSNYEFEATLVFIAFDLEEKALCGSSHYAAAHAADNILGMVSMDMVAYNPAANHDMAWVYGRAASVPIKQAVADALTLYGGGVTPVLGGDVPSSDHAPFEAAGWQACLLIEYNVWTNPNYHSTSDNVDMAGYLDYDYALNMTRGAVGWMATAAVLVPEPATLLLLGLGVAPVLLWRRRRS